MNTEKEKRDEMWKTVIDIVDEGTRNQQLAQILDVLRNYLVYDDPGLFSAVIDLDLDEVEREASLNLWLLNQITYYESVATNENDIEKYIQFQKDMLSASLLRKRALFRNMMLEYIKFCQELHEGDPTAEEPIKISIFSTTDITYISKFLQHPKYLQIEVKDLLQREKLIENKLKIFIDIAPYSIDLFEEMFTDLTQCILKSLDYGQMTVKNLCLEYMAVIINSHFEFATMFLNSLLQLCNKLLDILPLAELYKRITNEELTEFSQKLLSIMNNLSAQYKKRFLDKELLGDENKNIIHLTNIIRLISSTGYSKYLKNFENLNDAIANVVIIIVKNKQMMFENDEAFKYFKLIEKCPKLMEIYQPTITKELMNESIQHKSIANISKIWEKIDEIMTRQLDKNSTERDEKIIEKNLIQFIEIFHLINSITFRYKLLQEINKIEENQEISCGNLIFFSDEIELEIKMKMFITNISSMKNLNCKTFEYLVNLLTLMLGNIIFIKFSNILQKIILDLLFSYINKVLNIGNNFPFHKINSENSLNEQIIKALSNLCIDNLDTENKKYFVDMLNLVVKRIFLRDDLIEMHKIFLKYLINFIINRTITSEMLENDIIIPTLHKLKQPKLLLENLKSLVCLYNGGTAVRILGKFENYIQQFMIICKECHDYDECECQDKNQHNETLLHLMVHNEALPIEMPKLPSIPNTLTNSQLSIFFDVLDNENSKIFLSLLNHFEFINEENVMKRWNLLLPNIVQLIIVKKPLEIHYKILENFLKELLPIVGSSLEENTKDEQTAALTIVHKFSMVDGLPEKLVYYLFKMCILFIIRYESNVSQEAIRLAIEMCHCHDFVPRNFLFWYQRDLFQLIVALCASMYLRNGLGLKKSLNFISRMFGYKGPSEFIYKHYEIIMVMLLKYYIIEEKCEVLLQEVVVFTKLELKEILKKCFLSFYLEYFIDKKLDESNLCLEYIIEKTGCDILNLINLDIKKTVPRLLIYYHKNPKTVMETIRCLLLKENSQTTTETKQSNDVIKFIADQFLGVITFFEIFIMNSAFEKCLKVEILRSLGEIIRFLGSQYITPFHFKIVAMLTTITTLKDDNLKIICVDIWNIFIHNVDVHILGPSLSRIVAALEPLLVNNPSGVDAIYKFLIISNANLLNVHIPDLYFLENLNISDDLKKFVRHQIDKKWKTLNLFDKIDFFVKEITHENVIIRVKGLKYLTKLFAENRDSLNKMILGQNFIHPLIETVVSALMIGCKHVDVNLKLDSGKCIGELGAIEPGLMRPNYCKQKNNLPLDIHCDSFAIMALTELCKAYQFQKNTLYVDNFSLGMQEILAIRGISPKTNSKMQIWNAIPERMQQILEPLLTSCYTGVKKYENLKCHPVFNSLHGKNVFEWGYNWSVNMVQKIEDEETKHLLNSLLPSLRRDSNILDVFLPYIFLHAVQNSSATYRKRIFEEIECVLGCVYKKPEETPTPPKDKYFELPVLELDSQIIGKTQSNIEFTADPIENIETKCAKICFELLDFLEKWMREFLKIYVTDNQSTFQAVKEFCANFDEMQLALANFKCGEYARALKYCESSISNSDSSKPKETIIQENLSFLIQIYVELMDTDSLEGAIFINKQQSSLNEQILVYTMTDQFQEAAACYEQLIKELEITKESTTLNSMDWDGMVQCYLRLDTPETAILISQGLMQKFGTHLLSDSLHESQVEPLWRLGRFDELNKLLTDLDINESDNWQIQCAQSLVLFHKAKEISIDEFELGIDKIRQNVLKVMKFGGGDTDSYHKAYSQITRLHLLTDIEKARFVIHKISLNCENQTECVKILNDFLSEWNARLALLQRTIKISEPFLCLHRILLIESKQLLDYSKTPTNSSVIDTLQNMLDAEVGKLCIRSVQFNRKAGCYQQAHLSILNAEKYNPETLFIEKAKLYWKKGDQTNCFKVIEEKINEICKMGVPTELPEDKRLIYAEAKFLQASYNAESMNISFELNLKYFHDSLKCNHRSEKCYVSLAQYYDRMYGTINKDTRKSDIGDRYLVQVLQNYGKSLNYGCEFMYQSMPRMLSIWFDVNTPGQTNSSQSYNLRIVSKINEFMEKCAQCLPLFLFFTALSQIVSRICHPSEVVWKTLRGILIRLIEKYPQHSLWMILPVFKSSLSSRVKRCSDIFNDKRLRDIPKIAKLIKDFNTLIDKFVQLTNYDLPNSMQIKTVSEIVPALPKLLANSEISKILVPYQVFMEMTLPAMEDRNSNLSAFNPFPNNLVYIQGIREEIVVLNSLQKPKKVTLIGTDGRDYTVMLKARDDLRKDFRLMEFNAIVKQYLYQDPQARERRMGIRTYAVVPLNEESGIIEWVDNVRPFRQILLEIYKKRNLGMNSRELKKYTVKEDDAVKRRNAYLTELLPKHPPVFNEWFLERFTNPHNWYQARTSYIRKTAVMSIVGYILGLGDRHGENILFDESSGDTVHVDFNCLFNRGESFAFPEKVPFRLTHNMVHAMGPLGIEGPFKKCCEITMRILQTQTPILMSVLKPFIYDPLVSWNTRFKHDKNIERTDDSAITNVKRIEARLKGFVNYEENGANMPLSPEGVVNYVILKATDIDNLSSMYVGWGPYL